MYTALDEYSDNIVYDLPYCGDNSTESQILHLVFPNEADKKEEKMPLLVFILLAEKVRYLKTDPNGVDLMCKLMEDLREESLQRGIEKGVDLNRVESIKNIMEGLKYTTQQAMDLLKIPVSDQPKYLSKH